VPRAAPAAMSAEAAQALGLLTQTKLAAVLRPQHVVTIKDSASVDQTLRASGSGGASPAGTRRWWAECSRG